MKCSKRNELFTFCSQTNTAKVEDGETGNKEKKSQVCSFSCLICVVGLKKQNPRERKGGVSRLH